MFGTLFIAAVVVLLVVFVAMPLAYIVIGVIGWCFIIAVAFVYASIAYVVGKVDHIFRKLTA